jgi:hypothetical protein
MLHSFVPRRTPRLKSHSPRMSREEWVLKSIQILSKGMSSTVAYSNTKSEGLEADAVFRGLRGHSLNMSTRCFPVFFFSQE